MDDYFALCQLPRRPWLDPDALKAEFLALSTQVHPDRFHHLPEAEKAAASERYTALNTANQCLSDPKERLRHLLELELGAPPRDVQRIPPGTMDLFMEVGQRCREVDAFLGENAAPTSPLLKVQRFARALEWTDRLQLLQESVNGMREKLLAELQAMNAVWESAPPIGAAGRSGALPLERVEQVYRLLSYLSRWTEQLQERLVQLAL
jgi:curved DNA-binding protein CbpA